jgi:hypothetical protein
MTATFGCDGSSLPNQWQKQGAYQLLQCGMYGLCDSQKRQWCLGEISEMTNVIAKKKRLTLDETTLVKSVSMDVDLEMV